MKIIGPYNLPNLRSFEDVQSFQGGQDIFIDSRKGPKEIFKKVQKKVQIGQNHHFLGKFVFLWGGTGLLE